MNKAIQPFITAIVLIAAGVGIYMVLTMDTTGRQGNRLGDSFDYDLDEVREVDAKWLTYRVVKEQRQQDYVGEGALAVDGHDAIYIAVNGVMYVLNEKLAVVNRFSIPYGVHALAVDGDGSLYLGMTDRIKVLDKSGKAVRQWDLPEGAFVTSTAVSEDTVYVADKQSRSVRCYDKTGTFLRSVGERDQERGIEGFSIPSRYFDVAVGKDGLLWVVNPGHQRLEAYTPKGDLEYQWGISSTRVEGFCGCCNPSHFAILPNGGFVTSEKGITRIKVYNVQWDLEAVVAGPKDFVDHDQQIGILKGENRRIAVEVAADSQGRIISYDSLTGDVKIYIEKGTEQ